ncbi:hypothetical protein Tco_0788194, partial [Tanacetum coccineum]
YFSSGLPPTEPALLPQPPPKDSMDLKPSEFGPTVLSPNSRKTRVMPEKGDDHGIGNERSGPAPMSIDFLVFDHKPPVRPTINRCIGTMGTNRVKEAISLAQKINDIKDDVIVNSKTIEMEFESWRSSKYVNVIDPLKLISTVELSCSCFPQGTEGQGESSSNNFGCEKWPLQQHVSVMILTHVSSASREVLKLRVHTKKRNRLEVAKMNNLVYVQANANLMEHNKKRKARNHEILLGENASEAQEWIVDGDDAHWEAIGDALGVEDE